MLACPQRVRSIYVARIRDSIRQTGNDERARCAVDRPAFLPTGYTSRGITSHRGTIVRCRLEREGHAGIAGGSTRLQGANRSSWHQLALRGYHDSRLTRDAISTRVSHTVL